MNSGYFQKQSLPQRDENLKVLKIFKQNVKTALKVVPQKVFQNCFQQWQHRWFKCIAAPGECFEGDPVQ
jgi:hypothetical protein